MGCDATAHRRDGELICRNMDENLWGIPQEPRWAWKRKVNSRHRVRVKLDSYNCPICHELKTHKWDILTFNNPGLVDLCCRSLSQRTVCRDNTVWDQYGQYVQLKIEPVLCPHNVSLICCCCRTCNVIDLSVAQQQHKNKNRSSRNATMSIRSLLPLHI